MWKVYDWLARGWHPTRWTLRQGRTLIASMQPSIHACGFHACLAGGVLNKGYSDKDLDIWILPMLKDCPEIAGEDQTVDRLRRIVRLFAYLHQTLGSSNAMTEYTTPYPTLMKARFFLRGYRVRYATPDTHEVWLFKYKRIDVFVVGFGG